jgi:glycosyltransferase involved in cell wall biosynthesis
VDWPKTCAVVVPCLNEAAAIGNVVAAVRNTLPSVIVVDDGSTDATGEVARTSGATVLRHDRPSGKGAALRTGWKRALDDGFSWVLSMDGDGQHAPEDIPKFLERGHQNDVALVSGNRMDRTDAMPFVRRYTNRFMSWQLSRIAGVPLPDSQCGFRLMRLDCWARLPICTDCFEIESEVLLQFARAKLGIGFVPIQVIYAKEKSKIRPVRDTLRWWRWLKTARQSAAGSSK